MAISIGRALGSAIAGTLKGAAESVEAEDKERKDLTKLTVNSAMKRYAELEDERKKRMQLIEAEDNAVKALKGQTITLIDGKKSVITEAQARAAIRRYGVQETNKLILSDQIQFGTEGAVSPGKDVERTVVATDALEQAIPEDSGILSRGRYESVQKQTKQMLSAMGIDPKNVVLPGQKEVSNVVIEAGPGTTKTSRDAKYTNIPGIAGGMVTQVTRESLDGSIETRYEDLLGNDVSDVITQALSNKENDYKIADSYDAVSTEIDIREMGLAFNIGSDGQVKALNYEIAYTDSGQKLRSDSTGKFSIPVKDPNILTLTASQIQSLGGMDGVKATFDVLGKEGRAAYKDFNERVEAFENLTTVISENVDLLETHGNKLVTDVGQLAQLGAYVENNFGVAIDFAGDFIEVSVLEEAYNAVSGDVDNLQSQLESADPKDKLAIAQKIYAANQIILAYNYAKSTGDTRISNQDFDAFIKTVSAGSKESQKAIYQSRLKQALSGVNSSYKTLTQYTSMAGSGGTKILNSISEDRSIASLSTKVDSMFESTVPTRSEQQIVEEVSTNIDKAKQFRADTVLYNPKTNQLTNSNDPDRITVIAVLDSNGNLVLGTDNQPIIETDPNADAKYVESMIPAMIGNDLIKVK